MTASAPHSNRDKALVILNPAAKGSKAQRLAERVARLSPRVVVRRTNAPGEARSLAAEGARAGFHTIIAAGGDGTINEVVNGIAGHNVRFGLLPAGTMNVFASELGLPQSLEDCWEVIESGFEREVDLGKANDRLFVQLAGVGLDAQVVRETRPEDKKAFGPLSYLATAAVVAARTPPRLIVTNHLDRSVHEGSFLMVGNGRYYGGPFELFKGAAITDGLLDALIFQNLGFLDIVRYLQGILFGTHTEMPGVIHFRTTALRVESDSAVPFEVDGELHGAVPVEFAIAPAKLRVLAPR